MGTNYGDYYAGMVNPWSGIMGGLGAFSDDSLAAAGTALNGNITRNTEIDELRRELEAVKQAYGQAQQAQGMNAYPNNISGIYPTPMPPSYYEPKPKPAKKKESGSLEDAIDSVVNELKGQGN